MLSAIYAHYTQDRLWKKVAILGAALLFALIGNASRLVSIFAVGRFFGQDLAGGPYHNISGYLTFPFAIAAMVLFGQLLNIKISKSTRPAPIEAPARYDYSATTHIAVCRARRIPHRLSPAQDRQHEPGWHRAGSAQYDWRLGRKRFVGDKKGT